MAENFNLPSFGAGFGAGVATTFVAFRAWRSIQNFRNRERGPRRVVQVSAPNKADQGYETALVELAQTSHLLGHKIALADILLEPEFMRLEDLVDIPREEEDTPIFNYVPRVYDFPFLHSEYNIPTISLETLSLGHPTLVLVGMPGSGRTTALFTIAMWSMGVIDFKPPLDPVQEQLLAEESDLTPEEVAERVKNRVALAEQARQQYLSTIDAQAEEALEELETEAEQTSSFRELVPMYVHLSNVLPHTGEYGRSVDPAEPLMRGLQAEVGWFVSKRMVNNLYALLKGNGALVLIDGYDDLPSADRERAQAWIQAFLAMYAGKGNRIIICAPPNGHGIFAAMGAVPVFLKPWNHEMRGDHLQQWANNWESLSARPIALQEMPDGEMEEIPDAIRRIQAQNRGLTSFDFTLQVWAQLEGRSDQQGIDLLEHYLRDILPDADILLADLQRYATYQLDNGYIRLEPIVEQLVEEELAAAGLDDDADSKKNAPDVAQLSKQISRRQAKILKTLVKENILVPYREDRFQFRFSFIAAYLGALSLAQAPVHILLEKHQQQDWANVWPYLSQMRDIDALVAQQLSQNPDVLHEPALNLTRWLPYAGEGASWRNDLLKYLGNLMLAPHQYSLVRERIAAALVSSRDPGALLIFRRAIQDRNADSRRIGALALGALRESRAVDLLADLAVQDQDKAVQIACTLALGAIATEESLFAMVDLLQLSGDSDIRRAVAESLAANRQDGYLTLYDALGAQDMLMRRAAVFGLARVRADWALVAINEAYLEDAEWYVRSAAQVIFQQLYEESLRGIQGYPAESEVPWLLEWREEQVELGNLSHETAGRDLLMAALNTKDDPLIRLLAMVTIGQVGIYDLASQAYQALHDRQEAIRDAAYRTLGEFQMKLGKPLPTPA